jgi:hypothetical protein
MVFACFDGVANLMHFVCTGMILKHLLVKSRALEQAANTRRLISDEEEYVSFFYLWAIRKVSVSVQQGLVRSLSRMNLRTMNISV